MSPSHAASQGPAWQREVSRLPGLPDRIRYLDEYSGRIAFIEDPEGSNLWRLVFEGRSLKLRFEHFHPTVRPLVKHWMKWLLSWTSPASVAWHFWSLRTLQQAVGSEILAKTLGEDASKLREFWHSELFPKFKRPWQLLGLKSLLHYCAEMSIGGLTPGHRDFVRGFRLPARDAYLAVRSGAAFLTVDEERLIIDHFDSLAAKLVRAPTQVSSEELREVCVLIISYQYAFRPTQIARVRMTDARVFPGNADGPPAVHISFQTVKQRRSADRYMMKRSIKREWSPLFQAHIDRQRAGEGAPREANAVEDSLFGMCPGDLTVLIGNATERITGIRRTATQLRHTAAQRMADAGATIAELAAFLGHTSLATALLYYDASPTQAEIVNKAMGLSPIYQAIADVHRTRTIDKVRLWTLPPDQQIGAAPHGIPIAGIGACEVGQSLCAKNPVLSCYTCRKFLAVRDNSVHQLVLDSLRPVVRKFFDASRGEQVSPAFAQLSLTLAAVERVMDEARRPSSDS